MEPSKKILHLEDDPEWVEIIRNTLNEYEVYSAHTLSEAAKFIIETDFDAAVLDISLIPDDSQDDQGEWLLKVLEGLSKLPGKRIIVLSAYLAGLNQERTRKYFKYYHVMDAIPKQRFDSKEFRNIVDDAMNEIA